MSTLMMKLQKTNYPAILLILVFIIWQGYGLYQGSQMGAHFDTVLYTNIISSVMPSAMEGENQKVSLINQFIYFLTDVDMGDYSTFISKNIPFIQYQDQVYYNEDGNHLIGFKKRKNKDNLIENNDYFSKEDELFITNIDSHIIDDFIDRELLESDSYVTSKLINFDANLNFEGQAMKYIDTIKMLEKQFTIDSKTGGPKVIIFHTHPKERFADEEPSGGGVVDLGRHLKDILETKYGIETYHCTSSFEATDDTKGKDDYGRMQIEIKEILKENPTIEVAIDIHRDSIKGDQKFLTDIEGTSTAKIMFVNGFSKIQKQGKLVPIESLPNPYFNDNLGLSLQMNIRGNEKYPSLVRKNLIKSYRYSLHMKPMSLLVEVGNQNNTKQEAMNSMDAFAEVLMDVIKKE